MPGTHSLFQELSHFCEVAWLDLPAEAGKILLGASDEKSLREAGWKAYDAWIRLANEFTNIIYADPIVGQVSGRMMESALRLRQIGGAMVTASLSNLWPSIGLPTSAEIAAVRGELLALRQELASREDSTPYAHGLTTAASASADPLRAVNAPQSLWSGALPNGYRTNGNGHAAHRSHQEKRHVAA